MNLNAQISKFFGYLVDLGYNETFCSNNIVRYDNSLIIIEISYNEYSYEIDANFILLNSSEKVSLEEVLLYLDINAKGTYQFSDKDKLDMGLEYISNAIKRVLDIINDKNGEIIHKVFLFAEENRQIKLANINRKSDFDKAEKFWKEKNYDEVLKIYSKYDDLPELYKKRLNYICNKAEEKSDLLS